MSRLRRRLLKAERPLGGPHFVLDAELEAAALRMRVHVTARLNSLVDGSEVAPLEPVQQEADLKTIERWQVQRGIQQPDRGAVEAKMLEYVRAIAKDPK